MATVRWWFGGVYGGRGYCRFSRRSSRVGSATRRAPRGTTGRGELRALGHDVRLMAPSYVKPYVKRHDAADAEAICEAVNRPTMRFVPVKTVEQQSVMVLHRTRLLLMRQRIRLSNAIRGHMAEYGIVAPVGRQGLQRLIETIADESDEGVPPLARACLQLLVSQLQLVNAQALETDRQIKASARATDVGRRLMEIPGVGPVLASAIVASVPDPHAFRSGRNLAAWIGLVPRQNSSGGCSAPGSLDTSLSHAAGLIEIAACHA